MALYQPLQEQAYTYLKEKILSGEIEEGVFYSEARLGNEIHVSRSPMRTAILRLAQEGYLEIVPNKGFQLRTITEEDVWEVYHVRSAVEGYCCSLLQEENDSLHGQAVLKSLQENIAHMEILQSEFIHGKDDRMLPEKIVEDDVSFHQMIIEYSSSEHLMDIFNTHRQMIARLIRESYNSKEDIEMILKEHRQILKALQGDNKGDVYASVYQHLTTTRNLSLTLLPENLGKKTF